MSAAAGAGARAGPFVVENANNDRRVRRNAARMGPFLPENAFPNGRNARRANNRTRRNVRPPMGIYVPENAGANANARPAARALPTTPGYGKIDLLPISRMFLGDNKPDFGDRYVIAYWYKRGGYTSDNPHIIGLVDNHGQMHIRKGNPFLGSMGKIYLDIKNCPIPLPDIVVDNIKLIADAQTDLTDSGLSPNGWNPVTHVANLTRML